MDFLAFCSKNGSDAAEFGNRLKIRLERVDRAMLTV